MTLSEALKELRGEIEKLQKETNRALMICCFGTGFVLGILIGIAISG